jgi:adenylate cyclase
MSEPALLLSLNFHISSIPNLTFNLNTMNRITLLKLKQLGIITFAWLIIAVLMSVYDHLVLYTAHSEGPSASYSFLLALAFNIGSALVGALLGGSFMIFYVNVKYQNKSYSYTIVSVSLSFLVIILLIMMLLGIVTANLKSGKPIWNADFIDAFRHFLMDTSRIKNVMVWSIVVAVTQLLLQISSKFGYGTLGSILCGKYNTPKEEKRIFMFLDLNSSTAIAEQLGNEKYHELLKDFFADITHPILNNKGEIYQYVGDEVVIAWKQEEGTANSQCIRCFYDIKHCIESNQAKYLRQYGLIPTFKAGIHCGKVVAGEVGILKRDITYSGDVLNTTSRILGMCHTFNTDLIASLDLVAELGLSNQYAAQSLGAIKLRGKEKELMLSTLTPLAVA